MIRLVIFDLDGVLIDSKEAHFDTLNRAIAKVAPGMEITKEEHLSTYDGLSTNKKLHLLTKNKGLNNALHSEIWRLKQEYTVEELKNINKDFRIKGIFDELHDRGIKIGVASNAIRDTVRTALESLGVIHRVDVYYSNDDVRRPKPAAEIYLRCMLTLDVDPKETLIVEDSLVGRQGALASGAHLHAVKDIHWSTMDFFTHLDLLNRSQRNSKWHGGKMNVLIPMAGAGSRFEKAGYSFPKPLIDVRGKPMIQVVVENLGVEANYIFICQKSHVEKYNLKTFLNLIAPNCKIVEVDGVTEGAACTTLLAKEFIDNDEPLVIANSDQFIEWDASAFYYAMEADKKIAGGIVVFHATHPKWSFVKLDENGYVDEVAEKNPISDIATVGIYYWKKGSDYVMCAEQMISKNIRVNGEFYVAPVFNEALNEGARFKTFEAAEMWGLGTPEDLNYYLENHK